MILLLDLIWHFSLGQAIHASEPSKLRGSSPVAVLALHTKNIDFETEETGNNWIDTEKIAGTDEKASHPTQETVSLLDRKAENRFLFLSARYRQKSKKK
jgi:hypothetical protein